ncbi:exodeoxyribonuclease V subunit gamma [Cellulomonas hominis]|uniref:RecBCD enzyme subunit RecC n=1 Tax=Cellulomonas hominis TaxID=156981 RepID=A0A7Z8NSX9_9CELL|nr:exodeoxyribonuclease V subunit gamma [Cellulomonas hominis]
MFDVHLAEHSESLVAQLASWLHAAPDDPFAPDLILVPTRGVERWLTQRLAHHLGTGAGHDGVCANVQFDSPAAVTAGVVAAVSGIAPQDDPWSPGRLTWTVLDVLDRTDDPVLDPVRRHLGEPGDALRQGRRVRTAQRLSRLLLDYDAQRPAMTAAWSAGDESDGVGAPLSPDLAWQAALWREVTGRSEVPPPSLRLQGAVNRLVSDPHAVDLPARVSVFGVSRLPLDQMHALAALAASRSVHLWLPVPSLTLWRAAADLPAAAGRAGLPDLGRERLLSSMAGDCVELATQIVPLTRTLDTSPKPPPTTQTTLAALQAHIRSDATTPVWTAGAGDRSIEVHACHGAARQVEVLREVVVGLLAQDDTLRPRDVLVMCPDVERFAPLLSAVFGAADSDDAHAWVHPGRQLRVQVADRAPGGANALLAFVSSLLSLAGGRQTAAEVLDLLEQQPVSRRFELNHGDLQILRGWVQNAGISWGADLTARSRYGVRFAQGTWHVGLDRLALGVAMADDGARAIPTPARRHAATVPADGLVAACDIASTEIDLLGRFTEAVQRILDCVADLDGNQPVSAWIDALEGALDALTFLDPEDRWMQLEAARVLSTIRQDSAGPDPAVARHDIQALLGPHLSGRPTRAGFRTGALTVCSLEPMRQVPHRVVVLLGMDDQQFPRARHLDGDDILRRDPQVGERDDYRDERRLFLDAVLSASDHLAILYTGRHERTGAAMPPAVPVAELLDAIDDAVQLPEGPAATSLVVHHPLQPTDVRNFNPGMLGRPGAFSFDRLDLAAAQAGQQPRRAAAPFLPDPLPATDPVLDLDLLIQIVTRPVASFLRRRLGLVLLGEDPEIPDSLPIEVDGLAQWNIGQRLLEAALAGVDPAVAAEVERARGHLPPGHLADDVMSAVTQGYAPILDAARTQWRHAPASLAIRVDLPGRGVLTGSVENVHDDRILTVVYSRLRARQRLTAWVKLLAAAASTQDPMEAVTIGRPLQGSGAAVSTLNAPDPVTAARLLGELVDLAGAALREPLPLAVETSAEYARRRLAGDDVPDAMSGASSLWWDFDGRTVRGEGLEPAHELVFGAGSKLRDIATERAEPDGLAAEHTRFGELAVRIWQPLQTAETSRRSRSAPAAGARP